MMERGKGEKNRRGRRRAGDLNCVGADLTRTEEKKGGGKKRCSPPDRPASFSSIDIPNSRPSMQLNQEGRGNSGKRRR